MDERLNDAVLDIPSDFEYPETQIERKNFLSTATSYSGKTLAGVSMGVGEAGAEFVDFTTDLGVMSSIMVGRAVSAATGTEHDYESDERILKKKQDFFDKYITGQFKTEDVADEPYYNFVKNTTESVLKFAGAYKALAKTGLSTIQKVGTAGVAEGIMDDPNAKEASTFGAENGLRLALKNISPKSLEDFDNVMNPETDSYIARQSIRRVMNGIDIGLLSMGGQKAADTGGAIVKAIPDEYIQGVKGQFHNAMKTARVFKEKTLGKASTSKAAQYEVTQGIADEVFDVVEDSVIDPKKSLSQNMADMISVKFDSTSKTVSPEHYDAKIADYEAKLLALVPKIKDKVVSMENLTKVESDNMLREYAKELGVKETEILTEQGLKGAMKMQAHNILLEQEALKFSLSAKGFYSGAVSEDDFLASTKSFLTAQGQRAANASSAGRMLRIMQNSPIATKVGQTTKSIEDGLVNLSEKMGFALNDKQQMKAFGESLAENLKIKDMLDLSEDEFSEVLVKSILNEKTLEKAGNKMGLLMQIADTAGRTTQANLLTGPVTMTQNTLGTAAMQTMRIGEQYIKAGLNGGGVKEFHKANALLGGTMQGYAISTRAMVKAAVSSVKRNTAENIPFTTKYRQLAGDIPTFDQRQTRELFRINKAEVNSKQLTGNAVYDGLQKSLTGRVATSSWAFDIISNQDTLAKSSYAYGQMKMKMYGALYIDDVFDLASNPQDLKKAQHLLSGMMMNGTDEVSGQALKEVFGAKKALKIGARLDEWRVTATKESFDEAIDSVFQKELTGGLKATRDLLQEKMPFGKAIVPFFTTPVRILDESLQRMPVIQIGDGVMGLPISPKVYKDFMNPKKRSEAVSKVIMGNLIAYSGSVLTENGMYQPTPAGIDAKAYLNNTYGRMPGSFIIDNQSTSTSFLGPIHNLLGIGAAGHNQDDVYKRIGHLDDSVEQQFYDSFNYNMMNLASLVTEQPWVTGIDQITELLGVLDVDMDDERQKMQFKERMGRFFGQKGGNLFPASSLLRTGANNMMEYQKKANGMTEHFQAQFAPWLLENNAYDGYGNRVEPNRGILRRYKDITETTLVDKLYSESSFIPRRTKFKYIHSQKGDFYAKPSVGINLGELGLWNRWNEIKADGLGAELKDFANSQRYNLNIKENRVDENQKELQSIITTRGKRAFEVLREEHPVIDNIISKETSKTIVEKQKGKGYITGVSDMAIPTFTGE